MLVLHGVLGSRRLNGGHIDQPCGPFHAEGDDEVAALHAGILAGCEAEGVCVVGSDSGLADVLHLIFVGVGIGDVVHHDRGLLASQVGAGAQDAGDGLPGSARVLGALDGSRLLGALAVDFLGLHFALGGAGCFGEVPGIPGAPLRVVVGDRLAAGLVGIGGHGGLWPPIRYVWAAMGARAIGAVNLTGLSAFVGELVGGRFHGRRERHFVVMAIGSVGDRVLVAAIVIPVAPAIIGVFG